MLKKLLYGSLTLATAALLAVPAPGFAQSQQSRPMQQQELHQGHSPSHHSKTHSAHHKHSTHHSHKGHHKQPTKSQHQGAPQQ
jgi:hypothetical protein